MKRFFLLTFSAFTAVVSFAQKDVTAGAGKAEDKINAV